MLTSFCVMDKAVDDNFINHVIEVSKRFDTNEGGIGAYNDLREDLRRSDIAWLEDAQIDVVLSEMVYAANVDFYGVELNGRLMHQFSEYKGEDDGFIGWHSDVTIPHRNYSDRKLTCVTMLSDKSEYEGGTLKLQYGHEPIELTLEKGQAIMFPSYILHKVEPVTSGMRRTLVTWAHGPHWR